jgi:uncharacterized membrane protein YbaN (DUF454 family)
MKRVLKIALGWGFVLLGIAGLFLPILQGILFLAIGFSILATEQVWAERLLRRLYERFPQAGRTLDEAKRRGAAWAARFNGARRRSYDCD